MSYKNYYLTKELKDAHDALLHSDEPLVRFFASQMKRDDVYKFIVSYWEEMHAYSFLRIKQRILDAMATGKEFTLELVFKTLVALEHEFESGTVTAVGIEPVSQLNYFAVNQYNWIGRNIMHMTQEELDANAKKNASIPVRKLKAIDEDTPF